MYIGQLTVKNYRSLRDVHIGNLSPIVVLYGENDSGKSNVLSFLYHLFRQKIGKDLPETDTEQAPTKPVGFWEGEIEDFSDNFYKNQSDPIEFEIVVRFDQAEIDSITSMPAITAKLSKENTNANLTLKGTIESSGKDRARMSLLSAKLNNKDFYSIQNSQPQYLADFGLSAAEGLDGFTKLMSSLDDAFIRIPANRFVTTEKELDRSQKAKLEASTFKNWLFQTSLDRENQEIVRRLVDQFSEEPFAHGRVSLARVNDNLEVFVERKDSFKLPLGRKGTGVQQLLMILAYVSVSNSPFVGIEELEINLSPKSQTAVFDDLKRIIETGGAIKQIFLTTHSPTIAKRDEATTRGVWMDENEETKIAIKTAAEVHEFFKYPFA